MRKIMESTASPATYVASGTAFVFGLTVNEFAAVAGIVVAVATFCLNWYYKERAARFMEKSMKRRKTDKEETAREYFFED